MSQVLSRRTFTAEARIGARDSPRGICGGHVALGQVFILVLQFSSSPYSYSYHMGDRQ
jgi:hypothetical protein